MTRAKVKAPVLWVVLSTGDGWRREFANGVFALRRMAKAYILCRAPLNPELTYRIVRYVPAGKVGRKRK